MHLKPSQNKFAGFSLLLTIVSSVGCGIAHADPIGGIISYQGKLTNPDRTPLADAVYNVTFTFIANGTSTGVTQTIPIRTFSGVFSTFLNLGAMTFDPANTYELDVAFNGTDVKFPIASVPVAQVAKGVVDGAVTTAKIADGAITTNKLAPNAAGPGYIPVGGVIVWWSDGTVPPGWAVCDGHVITDVASPLNGRNTPNLTNRFVRAVSNADLRTGPQAGGADTINLAHSHTVNAHTHSIPNHTHTLSSSGYAKIGFEDGNSANIGAASTGPSTDIRSYAQAAGGGANRQTAWLNTPLGGATDPGGAGDTGSASPGTDSQLSASQSIVPAYVGMVYIMRIF